MKRSLIKIATFMFIVFAMFGSFTACQGQSSVEETQGSTTIPPTTTKASVQPIKILYPTYRVGVQVSSETERRLINEFKEQYGNEVDVIVEELPSDTVYTDKMKILAASNELPDIVEGKNGMLDIAVRGNQAWDLTDFLNADPEFRAEIGDDAINANLRNEKPYSISNGNLLVGYFYNKELFEKAGVNPAETWDEFMSNLEKLKALDVAPLALMTGENAWTTNLILASIVGTSGEAGNQFMNTLYPENYETPEMIEGLEKIQIMLRDYATKDALGGIYANAANNFNQGRAAIIANGPWMISDFSNNEKAIEGFGEKVGVAAYPGSGVFISYEIGYMICSKDQKTAEAAFKFLKFKTGAYYQKLALEDDGIMPLTSNVEISEDYRQNNPLVSKLIDEGLKAKYNYKFFDVISQANVIDTFAKLYPELAFERITAEEMAKSLTEAAARNR